MAKLDCQQPRHRSTDQEIAGSSSTLSFLPRLSFIVPLLSLLHFNFMEVSDGLFLICFYRCFDDFGYPVLLWVAQEKYACAIGCFLHLGLLTQLPFYLRIRSAASWSLDFCFCRSVDLWSRTGVWENTFKFDIIK